MNNINLLAEIEDGIREKNSTIPGQAHATMQDRAISCSSIATVTFRSVSVVVRGLGTSNAPTCLSALQCLNPSKRRCSPERRILQCVSGQVRPGEMLLVLGRPGSGCTTLLKIISGQWAGYAKVEGDVGYPKHWLGSTDPQAIRNKYAMSDEGDQHFPTLTVEETIEFAAASKVPYPLPAGFNAKKTYVDSQVASILTSLGMNHTRQTIVGNDFVRGISGGERRRVSLAEVMATDAPLQCWDNSTRGLDATSAVQFLRVLRESADANGKAIVCTLYQAGNEIFRLFDNVLVLAEGRQMYYGPASYAKQYFEQLGFVCDSGVNISDFLTSITVTSERRVRPGYESVVPNTPAEFEARFKTSHIYSEVMSSQIPASSGSRPIEVDSSPYQSFARKVALCRRRWTLHRIALIPWWPAVRSRVYTSSFFEQVFASSKRRFRVIRGDWRSMLLQLCASTLIAAITGSLYLELPATSNYLFARTGALCFPVLYFAMTRMSETTDTFQGRPLISRQKRLAINSPSAHAIAMALVDIPVIGVIISAFHVIYYFMVGFQRDVEKFFVTFLALLLFTLAFASMYRMIGAWCRHPGIAFQINGSISTFFLVYIGYMIPLKDIPDWLRWVAWMNPAIYAYNTLLSNEMSGQTFECVAPQYVPFGPEYDPHSEYHGCSTEGSHGGPTINGELFVDRTYWAGSRYMWTNLWILVAFWIVFAIMAAIGYELRLQEDSGSEILFKPNTELTAKDCSPNLVRGHADIDKETSVDLSTATNLRSRQATFTFKDISYFVRHGAEELQLLQNVSGFVKPGQLVALMGSSGAGKTTLMDVLAQRKDFGRITGSILVNGNPQDPKFQREIGYCAQSDIHEPTATVFESLVFSARLRQPYNTPDEDKISFVRQVMDALELTPLQHAIVGNPFSGLSIEQRKRLTIATELVARPTLLFLDEPTSGLDGQSAYRLCCLLRKLARAGQTIICTVHQPSASVFNNFDELLLLTSGGKTAYFGPIGCNATQVLEYFEKRGAPCPPSANPAAFIVDIVQSCTHATVDWYDQWISSEEFQYNMQDIDTANAHALEVTLQGNGVSENNKPDAPESKNKSFATPLLYQVFIVTQRQAVALWRNPDYVYNKILLHILNGLFGGFTFWKLGNGVFDMQLHLMAVFNFITIAPGCINQLQPLFIQNRDIFEGREKSSMTYHWFAFVAAQNLAEIPLLLICGTLVFVCWYFAVGLPLEPYIAGQVYIQMLLFEGLFTSIGQAIAAFSPNPYFSALVNPIIIGSILINFSGVVVPYTQIQVFWRYWLYYLNPFTYLLQGLLTPVLWDLEVHCLDQEQTDIPLPPSTRCGEYMAEFLENNSGYIIDPDSTLSCVYCPYSKGADYLSSINMTDSSYGWRGVGITSLFCVSSVGLIFLMMKIRTRATKTAGS